MPQLPNHVASNFQSSLTHLTSLLTTNKTRIASTYFTNLPSFALQISLFPHFSSLYNSSKSNSLNIPSQLLQNLISTQLKDTKYPSLNAFTRSLFHTLLVTHSSNVHLNQSNTIYSNIQLPQIPLKNTLKLLLRHNNDYKKTHQDYIISAQRVTECVVERSIKSLETPEEQQRIDFEWKVKRYKMTSAIILCSISEFARYPSTLEYAAKWIQFLLKYSRLFVENKEEKRQNNKENHESMGMLKDFDSMLGDDGDFDVDEGKLVASNDDDDDESSEPKEETKEHFVENEITEEQEHQQFVSNGIAFRHSDLSQIIRALGKYQRLDLVLELMEIMCNPHSLLVPDRSTWSTVAFACIPGSVRFKTCIGIQDNIPMPPSRTPPSIAPVRVTTVTTAPPVESSKRARLQSKMSRTEKKRKEQQAHAQVLYDEWKRKQVLLSEHIAARTEIMLAGRSNVGKSSLVNMLLHRKTIARTSKVRGKTRTLNWYCANERTYVVTPFEHRTKVDQFDNNPNLDVNKYGMKPFSLIDVPGYGFAKGTDRTLRKAWAAQLRNLVRSRCNNPTAMNATIGLNAATKPSRRRDNNGSVLKCILQLVDASRGGMQNDDVAVARTFRECGYTGLIVIVLTKIDLLPRGEQGQKELQLRRQEVLDKLEKNNIHHVQVVDTSVKDFIGFLDLWKILYHSANH